MSTLILSDLASEINSEHMAIEKALASAVDHAVKAGALLIQAKESLPHGGWAIWLEEHCSVSARTARGYMRLARELPKLDDANRQRVAELPLRDALSEFGKPKDKPAYVAPAPSISGLTLGDAVMKPDFDQAMIVVCEKTGEYLIALVYASERHLGYFDCRVFQTFVNTFDSEHDIHIDWIFKKPAKWGFVPTLLNHAGFNETATWSYEFAAPSLISLVRAQHLRGAKKNSPTGEAGQYRNF